MPPRTRWYPTLSRALELEYELGERDVAEVRDGRALTALEHIDRAEPLGRCVAQVRDLGAGLERIDVMNGLRPLALVKSDSAYNLGEAVGARRR